MVPGPGSRLRCNQCGSETIVVKGTAAELSCCGQPMEVTFSRPAPGAGS